jgi:hypothetical protein
MVDDGSNQYSPSGRLHSIVDNGDGTATITYKQMLTQNSYNFGSVSGGSTPREFTTGDKIFIYTPSGEVVCETKVYGKSKPGEVVTQSMKNVHGSVKEGSFQTYYVTVDSADINFAALEGYDLSDNTHYNTNKVIVDNLGKVCAGYTFDNVLIQNAPVRGVLIKAPDVTVTHCTFRNLGAAGIYMRTDSTFGEGTIARRAQILNCLFDNVGCANMEYTEIEYSPISIWSKAQGTSNVVDKSFTLGDITISGCKFINNHHMYTITVLGAKNIQILNNTIEPNVGPHAANAQAITLDSVLNVEISGNTYNIRDNADFKDIVNIKNNVNIFGTDVQGANAFPDLLP